MQAALVNSPALINAAEQETGNTPLHIAARHNLPGITGLLLRQNADPNRTNREGATPFDYLIASQSYHIEKTLSELLCTFREVIGGWRKLWGRE
ncbi:hypothetical protein J8F10_00820 [Gemmata sp. G18]|uniref:Ankyrin repeat domain-containing protein n=1 Tax=Gemmata palustris TaxID=2822762 RepID=A0ABS5BJG0_9BACT|nr:hypothetical protein [Gemmata palustris]